ncbi:MAG: hypothetical protein ACO2PP_02380 [Thermocrinis sp.]|uniref:hypothetical protein n=1 Tax=Thermocrinis sp. TaxID=2024383 RepID=UPI003C0E7ACE
MPVGPTDSISRNPSWMSYYEGFNFSFEGILFMPEVKARSNITGTDASATSQSKMFVVPWDRVKKGSVPLEVGGHPDKGFLGQSRLWIIFIPYATD